jgi:hypothetical protein
MIDAKYHHHINEVSFFLNKIKCDWLAKDLGPPGLRVGAGFVCVRGSRSNSLCQRAAPDGYKS